MSGGKRWAAIKSDFKKDPKMFGKRHSSQKFTELKEMLRGTREIFKNQNLVIKMCRKIVEEVANIVDHNQTWTKISVASKSNSSKTRCKIDMEYDGGKYFDPSEVDNVCGDSVKEFLDYKRKHSVADDGVVTIQVNLKIDAGTDID